ncbi:hypothetical protein [uncultured Shewanella sp.]|nr:hypothetical protein [uncultured Shewanella sp.]
MMVFSYVCGVGVEHSNRRWQSLRESEPVQKPLAIQRNNKA